MFNHIATLGEMVKNKPDLTLTRFEVMLWMCSWCCIMFIKISTNITVCISSKLATHTLSRVITRVSLPVLTSLTCLIYVLISILNILQDFII